MRSFFLPFAGLFVAACAQTTPTKVAQASPEPVKTQITVKHDYEWLRNPDGSLGDANPIGSTSIGLLCFLCSGETTANEKYGSRVADLIRYLVAHPVKISGEGLSRSLRLRALACAAHLDKKMSSELNLLVIQEISSWLSEQHENGGFGPEGKPDDLVLTCEIGQAWYEASCCDLPPELVSELDSRLKRLGNYLEQSNLAGWPNSLERSDAEIPGDTPGFSSRNESCRCAAGISLRWTLDSELHFPMDEMEKKKLTQESEDLILKSDWLLEGDIDLAEYYQIQLITNLAFQNGGSAWAHWRKKFEPTLRQAQNPNGFWVVSPLRGQSQRDAVLRATCSATMCLSVYYRFLPQRTRPRPPVSQEASVTL